MPRSIEQWHARFRQQAGWSESTRRYLVSKAGLTPNSRVLEVGCGTGVITAWLVQESGCQVTGIDFNISYLQRATRHDRETFYCAGNALHLPFKDCIFDAVVCHYFLLWIPAPQTALSEMVRVTRAGGAVIALAEPDYDGRIDAPAPFEALGKLQTRALLEQGAAARRGRELAGLLAQAGLAKIERLVIGSRWAGKPNDWEIKMEWEILESDLSGTLPAEELANLRQVDEKAWEAGERVLFVPTFSASGLKKDCQNQKVRL